MARAIADRVRISAAQHIANVMNTDAVNVVEEANLPTEISSPKIIRNTVIGALLGAFIAVVIIVIIYILDDTIKNPDDVERYLGLSVMGSIPVLDEELVRNNSKKKNRKKDKNKKSSDHSHVVATETLSDASKLVREAKAAAAEIGAKEFENTEGVPEFIEPKEPRGLDRRGDKK